MRSVAEITGQLQVALELARKLGDRRSAAIVGPEGTGKSRCAGLVGKRLAETHRVVYRRGDALLSGSAEAMLASALPTASEGEAGNAVLDVAQDVAQLISDGHIPFARTLRRLFKLGRTLGQGKLLTERQQSFLYELGRVTSGRHALLIADNLHYWDDDSLSFLSQIHNGHCDGVYPGLEHVRILLVWTPEQAAMGFEAKMENLFGRDLPVATLGRVERSEFRELLTALGAPTELPDTLIEQLYAISGGHLVFAVQIVEFLQPGSAPTHTLPLEGVDLGTTLRTVLESRLDSAGPAAELLRRLLQALSIIGEAARIYDLECVLSDEQDQLHWLLDQASRLGFIERSTDGIDLSHDVIRRVFLAFLTPDQQDWHERFSVCLSRLRPWDYSRRAVHLTAAARDDDAETLRVMALLQGAREMRVAPADDWLLCAAPLSERVKPVVVQMQRAAASESERRYDEAIHELEAVPLAVPRLLLAERDVALARLLLLKRTSSAFERGIALLDDIGAFKDEEFDLWLRIEEIRLVLLAYLGRTDEARKTELEIRSALQPRASFDPFALHAENRLRRRAESLHGPRIANDRLKRALAYFDPTGDGSAPRDVVEYLLTLNNLGANELVLGKFEMAFERFARCYRAIDSAGRPLIRRVEIVASNLVVAHYLVSGIVPESVETLDELTSNSDVLSSDGALVRSNVGALLACRGKVQRALVVLEEAVERVLSVAGFDAYSVYFATSNLAVVNWLNGGRSDALQDSAGCLDELDIDFRPYAARRLELLESVLESGSGESLDRLVQAFRGPDQIGESWRLFGRPLALSDLQFWTEN